MWAKQTNRGFTIVELLIVIVVIAVLAAITVVAYNGIQQRADNTSRVAAAREWYKRIQAYIAANGAYPPGSMNTHACLGTGNPTDLDGNASDEDCLGSGNVKHPNATLNNALATLGPLPTFPADKIVTTAGIGTVAGISLRSLDTLDPGANQKVQYPFLYYWLKGANQDCVLRPVASIVTGGYTAGTAISTVPNEGGSTRCMILLPDPSSL